MADSTITTGVDQLITYLKDKDKLAIAEVSKALNIKVNTIQKWVDFLVEEKIIGVEYKFTVPYIYLNRSIEEKNTIVENTSLNQIKKEFYEKSTAKGLPVEHINNVWQQKIKDALLKEKENFYKYTKSKKIQEVDLLWNRFCQTIFNLEKDTINSMELSN